MDRTPTRLSEPEVDAALTTLPSWTRRGATLQRQYMFDDFVEAIGFMARAAIWAEKLNHHPQWSNLYRTVDVLLETHDVGGISALDLELAAAMDRLAGPAA